MMNWRLINEDPNNEMVRDHLKNELSSIAGERVEDIDFVYQHYFKGLSVLDIGVVAHVVERSQDANWRHGNIRRVASHTVGIDILENAVNKLMQNGYDVRLVDATSDVDIGERFDRVMIGDVIEHVDNPVALLRFAARHLAENGLIICTTPNPFFIEHLMEVVRNGILIPNAEHVSWITPANALELAYRAELSLKLIHPFSGAGNTAFRRAFVSLLKTLGLIKYEFFARANIFIFEKSSDTNQRVD